MKMNYKMKMMTTTITILFAAAFAYAQGSADVDIDSMTVTESSTTLTNVTKVRNWGSDDSVKAVLTVLLPMHVKVIQVTPFESTTTCTFPEFPIFGGVGSVNYVVRCSFTSMFTSGTNSFRTVKIITTKPSASYTKTFSAFVMNEAPDSHTDRNFKTVTIP